MHSVIMKTIICSHSFMPLRPSPYHFCASMSNVVGSRKRTRSDLVINLRLAMLSATPC